MIGAGAVLFVFPIRTLLKGIMTYKGECFCGAIQLEVSGEPEAMGYCHCRSCRSWSGGPVNAFSLWKPDAVHVTKGAEYLGTYQKTPVSLRQYCTKCGGHLLTNHPPLGLVDVFFGNIAGLEIHSGGARQLQRNCSADARWAHQVQDFPKEFGGSGEVMQE